MEKGGGKKPGVTGPCNAQRTLRQVIETPQSVLFHLFFFFLFFCCCLRPPLSDIRRRRHGRAITET